MKFFRQNKLILITIFILLAAGCSKSATTLIPNTAEIEAIGPQTDQQNHVFAPLITNTETNTGTNIAIPSQSDWVDHGTILEAGVEGEWDYYLWGGFAFSSIKKGDTYYLYYQGASDYRTEYDETVLWRAIGVATSKDGIYFTKHEGNPILTWFPNNNGEEGAVSSGVTFGESGETTLFYGANTAMTPITVYADTRVATSIDGLNFTDQGIALAHDDRAVWGSGDELFVVDAIQDKGQWIVYYIPNGTPEGGKLGVAYGNEYDELIHSSAVTNGSDQISVWGTAGHVKINSDRYALILNNVREKSTEVRLFSLQSPAVVSDPVVMYQFDEVQQAVLLLDEEKKTWFLYYRTFDNSYGVKTAPAGSSTSPSLITPQE